MDFYRILADLKRTDKTFGPESLKVLSYDQLILASSGNAGVCRCPLEDVVHEKHSRRAPYLGLTATALNELDLDVQMHSDILDARMAVTRSVPAWSDLSDVAKLYFKLVCLEAHPSDPLKRVNEVVNLFREVGEASLVPSQLAFSLRLEFQSALLSKPSDDWLRDTALKASNLFYGFVTGPEIDLVDRLELRDYVCTAGCFYPTR